MKLSRLVYKRTLLVFFLIISTNFVHATGRHHMYLQYYRSYEMKEQVLPPESRFGDSLELATHIRDAVIGLYNLGYLNADYRRIQINDTVTHVQFATGEKYQLAYLGQGNLPESMLNKVHYSQKFFKEKDFNYPSLARLLEAIVVYAENNGFPFASARLDSIGIVDQKVACQIFYDSGPLIVFDSVAILGTTDLKYKFLMPQLGIYTGKPYDQKIVDQIPTRITTLEFLELNEKPLVSFSNGKAVVEIKVSKRKVNEIDGIVGLLPNETNGDKLLVRGQARIDLHNLFASGKRLFIEWLRVQPLTQSLQLKYQHPKLLHSPLDVAVKFHLYKEDTTFINRNFEFNLSFLPGQTNHLGFTTDFASSRLTSTSQYQDAQTLPPFADFNMTYYGLEYASNTFDNYLFPRHGRLFALSALAGQKHIIKNASLNEGLYRGLDLNTAQYKLEATYEQFWGLGKNLVLRTRVKGGLIAGENVFLNDLFRIGGLLSLRGFNENFFYASDFLLGNFELRSVFSNNTYFMIFYDQGYIADDVTDLDAEYPFGIGAGFSLVTNAGIFNFVFALGKSSQQPLDFNFSKIHFGYIGRF